MDELNNPESRIFKETLNKQQEFIKNRLNKLRSNKYLDNTARIGYTKKEIVGTLNQGMAQNLIQSFFNYKTEECSFCNKKKGENGIRQFERAHCNNYSREDILTMAVDDIYIDDKTPLICGVVLRKFIEKHECCPIYMLCNICHNKYDNCYKQRNDKRPLQSTVPTPTAQR